MSLSSAVTGLENFQEQMDVIGNNIANVNTAGFKAASSDFADTFSNTLSIASSGSGTTSGSDSVQIGTGVSTVAVVNNWNQGSISTTGVDSDLAISGNGFFVVKDTGTGAQYLTRAGDFQVDANGYLITPTGQRVQGSTGSGSGSLSDIQIVPPSGTPTGVTVQSYTVDGQGNVNMALSNGTSVSAGQIQLENVSDPNALLNNGNNLFSNQAAAGLTSATAPGLNGMGNIQSGALELSNVDLTTEMANLITAQRAFEANSKIVTTSDQVLQTLIMMKQ
jgi:flagellar hook protein FlgE